MPVAHPLADARTSQIVYKEAAEEAAGEVCVLGIDVFCALRLISESKFDEARQLCVTEIPFLRGVARLVSISVRKYGKQPSILRKAHHRAIESGKSWADGLRMP